MPVLPGDSLRDPTRYQIQLLATGALRTGLSNALRPLSSWYSTTSLLANTNLLLDGYATTEVLWEA
jgi:hypothetical protein